MTLEKLKKIAAAVTASAILLLFILLSVMVYQMVTINGKKARIEELQAEKARLEQEQNNLNDQIDIWMSEWKIDEVARQLDYVYPDDK